MPHTHLYLLYRGPKITPSETQPCNAGMNRSHEPQQQTITAHGLQKEPDANVFLVLLISVTGCQGRTAELQRWQQSKVCPCLFLALSIHPPTHAHANTCTRSHPSHLRVSSLESFCRIKTETEAEMFTTWDWRYSVVWFCFFCFFPHGPLPSRRWKGQEAWLHTETLQKLCLLPWLSLRYYKQQLTEM